MEGETYQRKKQTGTIIKQLTAGGKFEFKIVWRENGKTNKEHTRNSFIIKTVKQNHKLTNININYMFVYKEPILELCILQYHLLKIKVMALLRAYLRTYQHDSPTLGTC